MPDSTTYTDSSASDPQAQPIDPELTAKLLGHGVAVSPVVTVEPRRRKFHKAIRLNMPAPTAHSQGMINQYSGSAPTLRLLCSITGGTTRAQWEDVTGSTPLTFVNDVVSFTTTVSARFWLMDCRNIGDATKMATELYKIHVINSQRLHIWLKIRNVLTEALYSFPREAIHVPFMAKFVVFAKRIEPLEARLRVFCMTDDKEDKTLEHQEHFTEVAKSRDVEVLEGKPQYIEFAGNLVPVTKSGEQLSFSFRAFRENRLPFSVRVKDQHAEAVGRCLFMKEAKVLKGEPPQQPICILNIVLPDDIVTDTISLSDSESSKRHMFLSEFRDYYRPDTRLADMSNLLGDDWVELAHQLGLTSSEINVIKSEYPESVAKQAQSMLRMWLSQSGNMAQTNALENALRRIGREDIIPQCLNVEQPSHAISRIKEEEIGYRLRKSGADKEDETRSPEKKNLIEHYDKYSAEEKIVEKSESEEEEDNFDKSVTERRERIEKRLSAERAIPASSQRREIVQEISSIRQQNIVEDKIAEVKQKVSEPATTRIITETIEIKTTTPSDSKVSEVAKMTTVETHKVVEQSPKPGEDAKLLEEVSQRIGKARIEPRLNGNEDPKSPKFSKTPPPSPADFLIKEQAATIQAEQFARFRVILAVGHLVAKATRRSVAYYRRGRDKVDTHAARRRRVTVDSAPPSLAASASPQDDDDSLDTDGFREDRYLIETPTPEGNAKPLDSQEVTAYEDASRYYRHHAELFVGQRKRLASSEDLDATDVIDSFDTTSNLLPSKCSVDKKISVELDSFNKEFTSPEEKGAKDSKRPEDWERKERKTVERLHGGAGKDKVAPADEDAVYLKTTPDNVTVTFKEGTGSNRIQQDNKELTAKSTNTDDESRNNLNRAHKGTSPLGDFKGHELLPSSKPTLELIIGRKEVRTKDASASAESRLTFHYDEKRQTHGNRNVRKI
ncbi:ankyrin-2-like [Cylas formicarius]|uniref:ankyrin-2-like n=1 Tax=Cylas formicarius TaxID=197179 RepID=UPI0029584A7D|nr:ankyrin-2-like [Cylas formicarius]